MSRSILRSVFFLLCVLLLGGTLVHRLQAASAHRQQVAWRILQPEPREGPAPDFSLTVADGSLLNIESLRGRWVLVNFWATWCAPCLQELPHLVKLVEGLSGSGLMLLIVSVNEDWALVRDLSKQLSQAGTSGGNEARSARLLNGEIPGSLSALDSSEVLAKAFGTSRYPETYLIDPDGNLRYRFLGPKPWGREEILDWFGELLR